MKKLLIALLATAPLFAMAEARYRLYFYNPTNKDITLTYQSSSCMHGRGDSEFTIPAKSTYPSNATPMNLLDSNAAFTCNNSEKYVTWSIKGAPADKREITFRHFIVHTGVFSNEWVTRIEDNGPLRYARCDRWHPCHNTDYASNAEDTRIDLTLANQ